MTASRKGNVAGESSSDFPAAREWITPTKPATLLGITTVRRITFTTQGDVEGPTTYVGIDGFKQALGVFSAVWSQIRWEIEDITGTDDAYVIDLLFHLQAAASGVPIQVKEAWAVWMEDGKYLWIEQYGSRSEALEAAGLSE